MNKILHGDCTEIMKDIKNDSIDLTVTSPPYDYLRDYNKNIKENESNTFSFPFDEIVNQLYRVTKKGGIVVWVVGDQVVKGGESCSSFKQALTFVEKGFLLYDTMIYHKNGSPFPEKKRYSQVFEYMFVFSKGKPKTTNIIKDKKNKWAGYSNFGKRMMRTKDGSMKEMPKFEINEYGARYNVWNYNTGKGYSTKDNIAFNHPAIFPEELAEDHILSWSNEGDVVLDPMCGSGTVLKMAKINNRDYIGIDVDESYIKISEERVKVCSSYTLKNQNPKEKFIKKDK